jgi:hypothetical protein
MDFKQKYLKYKQKYINLKNHIGCEDRCPFKIGECVIITGSVDDPDINKFAKITDLLFKELVIKPSGQHGPGNQTNICIRAKVDILGGEEGRIKNTTNLRNLRMIDHDNLGNDPIFKILINLPITELITIYKAPFLINIKEIIENYPFDFYNQQIPGGMTLAQFRNIFKAAIGINLKESQITDAEFIADIIPTRPLHLGVVLPARNLRINISLSSKLTDAALEVLNNRIHTLNIVGNIKIKAAGFVYLRGIHTLDMQGYYPPNITNECLEQLSGIHTLNINGCHKITNDGLAHITGIHTLNMSQCPLITDSGFVHLRGINTLILNSSDHITGIGFAHLAEIQRLDIRYSTGIIPDSIAYLRRIKQLKMIGCNPATIAAAQALRLPVDLSFR